MSDPRPIGIFDSGIGGLTVLKEINNILPSESLIYLGDTARVPYGTKSKSTVVRYSRNIFHFLKERDVKMVVVACNTASAYALDSLVEESLIPVIGVVEGGVKAAVEASKANIGVIGTEATILSQSYNKAILAKRPESLIISKACPLFVGLVEEGWTDNSVARSVVFEYLGDMKGNIDTLVLGCTHYPLLKNIISDIMGSQTKLIDSAEQTAIVVKKLLVEKDLLAPASERGKIEFCVTDSPDRSAKIATQMLGDIEFDKIQLVDIKDVNK